MPKEEFIFGIHSVNAALMNSSHAILELYVLQERQDQRIKELLSLAQRQQIPIFEVTKKKLDELSDGGNHQGVLARCKIILRYTEADLPSLLTEAVYPPLILILDEIQDPHNLGACLRTANAAGVNLVIAPKDNAVGLTAVVRKIACGAAEITPFIQVTNLARTLRWLKEQGIWLYGAVGETKTSLYEVDVTGPAAFILGSEEKGLRRLTRELCDFLVAIPMYGTVESLNVSVATGICLFETVRQRL